MQKRAHLLDVPGGRAVYEFQLLIEIQKVLQRQARYLGTLEALLALIDRDLQEPERFPYWEIVASQLTSVEAKYIFYCCLVAQPGDRLRELLHSSKLLRERIEQANLSRTHIDLYERMHNIRLISRRRKLVTAHSRAEYKRLRRQARESMRPQNPADHI